MAADILYSSAEADLQRGIMALLVADAGVKSIFGDPARVYDDETQGPDYPYAVLERHEARPSHSQTITGTEHILGFGVLSQYGGRAEAREALGVLRVAIEGADVQLTGQRIILALVTYSDVLRTRDLSAFRGLMRVKILTEEAA